MTGGAKRAGRPGPGPAVYGALAAASASIVIFLYWLNPAFLAAVELKSVDAMFIARGARPAPSGVVVVAVDERSVNELGRWPWPRRLTARLIDRVGGGAAGAEVVAVDMVFSESEGPEADALLAAAVAGAGNVVLGFFFRDGPAQESAARDGGGIMGAGVTLVAHRGSATRALPLIRYPYVEGNIPAIREGARGLGSFNVVPSADGIYRKSHLLFSHGDGIYPSLALAALRLYYGSGVVVNAAPYGVDSIGLGGLRVPVDERGGFSLDFYGPAGSIDTVSAVDVIEGRVPAGTFDGRLVFVGVTETGIADVRPTPVDTAMPGVELHATVAANVLDRSFLARDTRVVIFDLALTAVLPFVLAMAVARPRNPYLALVAYGALLAILVAGDFFFFASLGVIAAPVYPALSVTLACIGCEAYRNMVVEKRSRFLRRAFSLYLSGELVRGIMTDPARLKLGGERRTVTVLFSDIRGFTDISEQLAPEELVALLNGYLGPMTEAILREGGLLDKYIGDAIMALFNTPVEVPDHAVRACEAALVMRERLEGLNRVWRAGGLPVVDAGVGVSTGEAVVGNMGGDLRFDYTAIGDTVNLASRLEGITKLYRAGVVVSESTMAGAKARFVFRELDRVRVKGRREAVPVYELLGRAAPGDERARDLARRYSEGLGLYRARRFGDAKKVFDAIIEDTGDGPSAVFASRCAAFMRRPPPAAWDGSYRAETK